MTDLRQAAMQALEALEDERYVTKYTHIVEAITALKAELAQPEQQAEPCIGKDPRCPCQDGDACHYKDCVGTKARPVAQPEQEPTQWRDMVVVSLVREGINKHKARELADHFATPPAAQRPWVGLTDEDRRKFAAAQYGWEDLLIAAEAKLKERNRGATTHCQCAACKNGNIHDSDCSVHNGDALPVGPCDCSLATPPMYQPAANEAVEILKSLGYVYEPTYTGLAWVKKSAQPEQEPKKLWLWKNFVDGKPEYWAFDNAFPVYLECDDPQTLGEPCGYAIFKPSREGRTDISDGEVLLRIKKVAAQRPWQGLTDEEILSTDPWEILRADPWMGTSDSNINPYQILLKVRTLEAKLKERNT
jgi:hypothetical protein